MVADVRDVYRERHALTDSDLNPRVAALLQFIDQGYDHQAWHGPNLIQSIGRTGAEEAAWRPGEGLRNIWEIVVHSAYWKYVVLRGLTNADKGGFPRKGSDWI